MTELTSIEDKNSHHRFLLHHKRQTSAVPTSIFCDNK